MAVSRRHSNEIEIVLRSTTSLRSCNLLPAGCPGLEALRKARQISIDGTTWRGGPDAALGVWVHKRAAVNRQTPPVISKSHIWGTHQHARVWRARESPIAGITESIPSLLPPRRLLSTFGLRHSTFPNTLSRNRLLQGRRWPSSLDSGRCHSVRPGSNRLARRAGPFSFCSPPSNSQKPPQSTTENDQSMTNEDAAITSP